MNTGTLVQKCLSKVGNTREFVHSIFGNEETKNYIYGLSMFSAEVCVVLVRIKYF